MKKKTIIEIAHGPIVKMLAFCHECSCVKAKHKDGKIFWRESVVVFDHLPKEKCYTCQKK